VKKPVISYDEYIKQKKISEALTAQIEEAALNENFLTSLLNFFKGLFDLFSNKEVKDEVEECTETLKAVENDEDTPDDQVGEEIDGKRVRNHFSKATKAISKQIEVDKEKGIRVSNELIKKLASWYAQQIAVQDMTKIEMFQKMLNNTEGSKRLTWIPNEYRQKPTDWYKDSKCVLDKSIKEAFSKVLEASPEKQENLILDFSKRYVEFVAKYRDNGLKKLKANDPDFLDDMFLGFAQMANNITIFIQNMMKNTPDEKVEEIIAEKIVANRKRRSESSPYKSKKELKDEEHGKEVSTEKNTELKKDTKSSSSKKEISTDNEGSRRSTSTNAKAPKTAKAPKAPKAAAKSDSTEGESQNDIAN
jgi:hypothetical protein